MDSNKKLNALEYSPELNNWANIEGRIKQDTNQLYDLAISPPEICWSKISSRIGIESEKNAQLKILALEEKSNSFSQWLRYAAVVLGITFVSMGMLNDSIRNKIGTMLLQGNFKTSLIDSQHVIPKIKKSNTKTNDINSLQHKSNDSTKLK